MNCVLCGRVIALTGGEPLDEAVRFGESLLGIEDVCDDCYEATCESCGALADLRLDDGSTWCISCDAFARIRGYDNRPATLIPRGWS